MKVFWLIQLFSSVLVGFILKGIHGREQEMYAFSNSNCTGSSFRFIESASTNGIAEWLGNKETSIKIVAGAWRITMMRQTSDGGQVRQITFIRQPSNTRCISKEREGIEDDYGFIHFERIGPTETSDPQLLAFEEDCFSKKRHLVREEYPLSSLDSDNGAPVQIECLLQFSNKAWIFYPERNYKGEMTCLCGIFNWFRLGQRGKQIPVDGLWLSKVHNFTVGSIRSDWNDECKCPNDKSSSNKLKYTGLIFWIFLFTRIDSTKFY